MSITKLHADHPLTRAGLQHIRVVHQLEVGLKPGDVVLQFPHGRVVQHAKAPIPLDYEGIVPKDAHHILMVKHAIIARGEATCKGDSK